ncbi:MAG: hypothetical protein GY777_32405 [Candidatus Brocadiaceae bacterium]|nr:hypothetical protein [Candidatus Brocadiaceae bacterium]
MMTTVFSLENIYRQYLNCRKNKRNTINALRFEYNLEENIARLHEELDTQTYSPSRSVCFALKQPKLREIFAADFRDRVVHHILVGYLEKFWEPIFIYDSFACRRGKGTQRAVKRLQGFTRKISRNGKKRAYFMQLDIRGFFLHINKEILYKIIAKKIRDEKILWLTRKVIFHDCTKDVIIKGSRELLGRIPPHKTLFGTNNIKGLPIGNLSSQFFANVYLNELDQFVKHHLKARHYIRYSDDSVLLHEEEERLMKWKEEIGEFLKDKLRLELNDRRQKSGPISNGIDFLGYIVRPDYLLVRRRVINRLKARLMQYQKLLKKDKDNYCVLLYDPPVLERVMNSWASYMAHLDMANAYRLRIKLLRRFEWLGELFQMDGVRLKRRREAPVTLHTLKGQYRFFMGRHPGSMLFFQVGRFYELYDRQAEIAIKVLGLKRMKITRGFQVRCGFPVSGKRKYIIRLLRLGFTVRIVNEGDDWLSRVKKRQFVECWLPITTVSDRRETY